MKKRINDKIDEIGNYLGELGAILPRDFKEYMNNFEKRAACERYFERIIEAVVDLAFLIIRLEGFEIPAEDKEAFNILSRKKIISEKLAEKFKDAKGMRNLIAHEYGGVDDEIVFHSIAEELEKDVNEFISTIKKLE